MRSFYSGNEQLARHQRAGGDRLVRWHRSEHLHDRLGLGRADFGPIADRYGRAKTMAITILIYATFTGLCGIANSWSELAIFRFLTGLGIGGE